MSKTWAEPAQLSLLPDPLDVRFAEYHQANPHIYDAIVDICREWKAAGQSRIGMKMVIEVLRWQRGIRSTDEDFAVNNSMGSRYARLVMANEPDLVGFFETRRLHGDGY
jgi:hypothetical protein